MISLIDFKDSLTIVLDHIAAVSDTVDYRLVGTGAALMQGVTLPTGDIDILVRERGDVDRFSAALAPFPCRQAPLWMPQAGQYYAEYEVKGIEVGISTVEAETDSDGLECIGCGPWEHYRLVQCGAYEVPAVALELRLVSELLRNRPERYTPLVQHMRAHGCDLALVQRGMAARGLRQDMQDDVIRQLKGASEKDKP